MLSDTLMLSLGVNGWLGTFIVKTLLNAIALFAAAYLMKGVTITDFVRAILAAVVISLLNTTLGSFLDFISMPINFITLGLFSFVIDAGIILMAAYFMKGFQVKSFWTAFFLAILLAIFNTILYQLYL